MIAGNPEGQDSPVGFVRRLPELERVGTRGVEDGEAARTDDASAAILLAEAGPGQLQIDKERLLRCSPDLRRSVRQELSAGGDFGAVGTCQWFRPHPPRYPLGGGTVIDMYPPAPRGERREGLTDDITPISGLILHTQARGGPVRHGYPSCSGRDQRAEHVCHQILRTRTSLSSGGIVQDIGHRRRQGDARSSSTTSAGTNQPEGPASSRVGRDVTSNEGEEP